MLKKKTTTAAADDIKVMQDALDDVVESLITVEMIVKEAQVSFANMLQSFEKDPEDFVQNYYSFSDGKDFLHRIHALITEVPELRKRVKYLNDLPDEYTFTDL